MRSTYQEKEFVKPQNTRKCSTTRPLSTEFTVTPKLPYLIKVEKQQQRECCCFLNPGGQQKLKFEKHWLTITSFSNQYHIFWIVWTSIYDHYFLFCPRYQHELTKFRELHNLRRDRKSDPQLVVSPGCRRRVAEDSGSISDLESILENPSDR